MAESYLNRIIKTGDTPTPSGYVRLAGVPDGESIITNAPVIENEGTNYYPIYYMCLMDTIPSRSFAKTESGADAYVFSDEPSTLYVGDTEHTFNVANDYATSESWKCRYVIAYATEANKDKASGIAVNVTSYFELFEFIGSQYLKLSQSSILCGTSTSTPDLANKNLRYVNLSNSSFHSNLITMSYFLNYCSGLQTLLLPNSLTTIHTDYFCGNCVALTSITLPSLTTISGDYFLRNCYRLTSIEFPLLTTTSGTYFLRNCYALKTVSLPAVITIGGSNFCGGCYALKYFEIPSTVTDITETNIYTLSHTQFIKLPTDFDIDGCNFTGATGYNKSLAWFTHLAAQLKDNSGGTAKTMVIGASNISLIPTDTATIISNKNWTLS